MVEILSVIDNLSCSPNYHAEHGLSLHIKQNEDCYLLDTGASEKFMENAGKMGVDLKGLKAVFISHNHYDHMGGLSHLLEHNKEVKVYIKNSAKSEFYYKVFCFKKNVGDQKGTLEKYADRFVFFEDDLSITDSFKLLSNNVVNEYYSCKDKKLLEKQAGHFVPDRFNHELFAVIEENKELIVVSSCSHSGIVNILDTVKEKYQDKPISHLIGGFHLAGIGLNGKPSKLNCSEDYIKEVCQILSERCKQVYTCHCTGTMAYNIMKREMGDGISYLDAGTRIIIN